MLGGWFCWLVDLFVGLLLGWGLGRPVGWLVGWLVGLCVCFLIGCFCSRIENRTCSRAHFRKIIIIRIMIIVTWISSCKAHTTFGGCDVGSVGWVLGGCDVGIIGITIIVKCIVEHDQPVPWLHEQVQYTRCWAGVVLSRLFACVDTRVKCYLVLKDAWKFWLREHDLTG